MKCSRKGCTLREKDLLIASDVDIYVFYLSMEAVCWDLSGLQGEDVIEEEIEDGQHHTGNEVLHFYSVF
jgi:hypothetical protein